MVKKDPLACQGEGVFFGVEGQRPHTLLYGVKYNVLYFTHREDIERRVVKWVMQWFT